jgi:hypothetical protein
MAGSADGGGPALTALYNVFPLPQGAGFRRAFAHAGEALDRVMHVSSSASAGKKNLIDYAKPNPLNAGTKQELNSGPWWSRCCGRQCERTIVAVRGTTPGPF